MVQQDYRSTSKFEINKWFSQINKYKQWIENNFNEITDLHQLVKIMLWNYWDKFGWYQFDKWIKEKQSAAAPKFGQIRDCSSKNRNQIG